MNPVGSRIGSTTARRKKIAICRHCKRRILPKGYGSIFRAADLHRGPEKEMVNEPTAATEKAKRRNERKARTKQHARDVAILQALRSRNLHEAQRIVLEIKGEIAPPVPIEEDCPECLKRQNAA